MRTERKLLSEFIDAAGAVLVEHFCERELTEMQSAGDSVFLMVEVSGRLFKGVHCSLKKSTGEQTPIFSLTEPEGVGHEE